MMIGISILFFCILNSSRCAAVQNTKLDASSLSYFNSESLSTLAKLKRSADNLDQLGNYVVEPSPDDFWLPVWLGYEGPGAEFLISNGLLIITNLSSSYKDFYDADKDKDGVISFKEFLQGYKTYNLLEISNEQDKVEYSEMNDGDKNKDGVISSTEFGPEYTVGIVEDPEMKLLVENLRKGDKKAIRYAFDSLDRNKDGFLERYELFID